MHPIKNTVSSILPNTYKSILLTRYKEYFSILTLLINIEYSIFANYKGYRSNFELNTPDFPAIKTSSSSTN